MNEGVVLSETSFIFFISEFKIKSRSLLSVFFNSLRKSPFAIEGNRPVYDSSLEFIKLGADLL